MKRFIMALIITVLMASLLLGSCGEPEETTPPDVTTTPPDVTTTPPDVTTTPPDVTTTPPDVTTTPADQPVYGGTLRIITPLDPTVLGYPAESAGRATFFQYCVQERLCIYAEDVWESREFEPWLATDWDITNDMKTYTFQLREGVTFHDDTPWNAEACKWNVELQVLEGGSATFNDLASIDVLDEYTIQYNFNSPQNTFLVECSVGHYMISPTAYEAAGTTQEERKAWAIDHPVGTGPFKLKDVMRGAYVKYEKFDDYWGGEPYLDAVEFLIVPDPTVSAAMMEAGDADLYTYADHKASVDLNAKEGFTARYRPLHSPQGMWPNGLDEESVYHDKNVRWALEYAIDREAIVNAVDLGSGQIKVMYQAPTPNDPAYRPDFGRKYDVDEAKRLMALAGQEAGFDTILHVSAATPIMHDVAVMIQAMLAEININVQIEIVSPGQYMGLLLNGWPANTLLMSGIPNEPISEFIALRDYRCHSPQIPRWNYSKALTPEMCALYDVLDNATTEETIIEAYIALSYQAMDDSVGVYLMDWPDTCVYADYVHTNWISYSTKVWKAHLDWMEPH